MPGTKERSGAGAVGRRRRGGPLAKPVSFRLTEADHAAYLAKVRSSGLTPSEFFRDAVLTNRTQVVAVDREVRRQILFLVAKASNNLNQLAHRVHTDHVAGKVGEATYLSVLGELEALAAELREVADAR